MDPNAVLNRVMRLARLDTSVFDEVRDDQKELVPAIVIVAVSALLASIGAWLWLAIGGPPGLREADVDFGNVLVNVILLGTIFAVVLWAVWVAITYVVLVQFYKEQADIQTLMRTMGYAAFPFSLSLLMLIPGISLGVALLAIVLWFVMSTYAVQAATTASSDKVVMSNAAGFAVFAIIMAFLAHTTGMTTGLFVHDSDAAWEGEYYDFGISGIDIDLDDLN